MADAEPEKTVSGLARLAGRGSAAGKAQLLSDLFKETVPAFIAAIGVRAGEAFDLTFSTVEMGNAGNVLNAHSESVVSASIRVEEWGSDILAGADRRFLAAIIEAVCGGSAARPAPAVERAPTKIELEIARWTFARLADALGKNFARVTEATFVAARADCPPAYDCIGKPSTPIAAATFTLGGGRMFIAIPQSALMFIRIPVPIDAAKKAPAVDTAWARSFGNRLGQADVMMRAVLGPMELTLGDIAEFTPKQIVPLDGLSSNRVRLECNDEPLYWCTLGQAKGAYTLSIDTAIDREEEVMNDILFH